EVYIFFFQAEDGIRDYKVTGVQTCALPILKRGNVAINGSTGAVLGRSLTGLRDVVDRTLSEVRLEAGTQRRERLPVITLLDEIADRKSTRLNSSHLVISYAVFCLKKKKTSI